MPSRLIMTSSAGTMASRPRGAVACSTDFTGFRIFRAPAQAQNRSSRSDRFSRANVHVHALCPMKKRDCADYGVILAAAFTLWTNSTLLS